MAKAARSLSVVRRAGKLFDCLRVLKICFNACAFLNLEYCAPVWMSSAESHLSLLDSVVRSAEMLCESERCCLGHSRKVTALCLLHKIHHRAKHPLHFVATRNTRASAALCELASVIPRCRTGQFSRLFLKVAVRLWNLLPVNMFCGSALRSFKSAMKLYLQRA